MRPEEANQRMIETEALFSKRQLDVFSIVLQFYDNPKAILNSASLT